MIEENDITKQIILSLPVTINSWIILQNYVLTHADLEVYKKLIHDYITVCPIFEINHLMKKARRLLDSKEFQELTEEIFRYCHGG